MKFGYFFFLNPSIIHFDNPLCKNCKYYKYDPSDHTYEKCKVFEMKNIITNEITLNTLNGYRKYDDESQTSAPLYQQAFRWLKNQYMTKRSINERGDYIEGNFFMLPLIFSNGYEIKLLKPSTSYTIVGGREIPFYAEPEAVYKESTESYESAELACLKKLIETIKNK
jgi:hypothetical protein